VLTVSINLFCRIPHNSDDTSAGGDEVDDTLYICEKSGGSSDLDVIQQDKVGSLMSLYSTLYARLLTDLFEISANIFSFSSHLQCVIISWSLLSFGSHSLAMR